MRFRPDERPAVEWLFLDADTPATARWLASALPNCAWTSHVVIDGVSAGGACLDAVVDHLVREPVAIAHLHLVVNGGFGGTPALERLMASAVGFQREAYRERTGARLVPLPILEVRPGIDPRPALAAADELASRLAKPSLLLWQPPDDATSVSAAASGLRIYLGDPGDPRGTIGVLTDAHVLDSLMQRIDRTGPLLAPCIPHVVVSDGRARGCAQQWQRNVVVATETDAPFPGWAPDPALCPTCIADSVAAAGPSLAANRRHPDGRQVALRVGAALAEADFAAAAATTAATAAGLSITDGQRVEALIQQALCRLAAHDLQGADTNLVEAASCGAPAGLIAYHRARVQVAWHDDIEALERYAEAVEIGTDAVTEADLRLEMALCHIRLEEWSEARGHLERIGEPTPAVAFNLGVCDVNSGLAERALGHFDNALELGPPAEDLGRVRFFRGFCLKELGRYDEAAIDLELSIELETPEPAHHNLLGFCLFKLGRHRDAITAFERAVALDSGSAIDWANIGVNLERLGELDRAAEMYRKALGMDRSIGFASEGLARLTGGR